MKKMIAVVLAALMLLTSFAVAESGTMTLIELSNINIAGIADLAGLEVKLATGNGKAQAEFVGDGQSLMAVSAQLVDGQLLIGGEGVANTYAVDLSQANLPAEAMDVLPQLFDIGLLLKDFVLPPFPGVNIPMLPIATLLGSAGASPTEDGGMRLDISSEQLMSLLDMGISMAQMYGGSASAQIDQVKQLVDQLKQSGTSADLTIIAKDEADASTVDLYIIPVQDGNASDTYIARLNLQSQVNLDTLTVYLNQGSEVALGTAVLESDPAAPALSLNINVMDQASFTFALTADSGLQDVTFAVDAQGTNVTLRLTYGPQDGRDIVEFAAMIPSVGDVICRLITTADAVGTREGDLLISAGGIEITGNVKTTVAADVSVAPLDGANAIDLLADGAVDQLGNDLSAAAGGLIGYISSLEPAA